MALLSRRSGRRPAGAPEPLERLAVLQGIAPFPRGSGAARFRARPRVLDQARANQADLRLYDGAGREIPYVLRVRREVETQSAFTVREFNRGVEGGAAVVSCDLGDAARANTTTSKSIPPATISAAWPMFRAAPTASPGPRWLPRRSCSASPPPAVPWSSWPLPIP